MHMRAYTHTWSLRYACEHAYLYNKWSPRLIRKMQYHKTSRYFVFGVKQIHLIVDKSGLIFVFIFDIEGIIRVGTLMT